MKREEIERNKRLLMNQLSILLEKEEQLELLPQEPVWDDPEEAPVVLFRKQFNIGGIYYSYAAVGVLVSSLKIRSGVSSRVKEMRWYVSGSRSMAQAQYGHSWEELVEWIVTGEKWEIWYASSFELVGKSDNA